jgi:hypothetical protein
MQRHPYEPGLATKDENNGYAPSRSATGDGPPTLL